MTDDPRTARRTEPSFCRICNAMCGIIVTVEGEQVVQVRGDPDHPLSHGYTCPKGRALPQLHHDPRRLNRPSIGGRDVAWDEMLDDLAGIVRSAIEVGGADSVAMYLASGSAFDSTGRRAAERFLRMLGSAQKYTATTIDTPSKPLVAELIGGWSGLTPMWDHERSTLLMLIGSNPVVSHGHSNAMPDPVTLLRRHRAKRGEVWVIDPRATETARLADRHLAPRPGTDWLVLAHVVRSLLADADPTLHERADGVDELADALAPFTPEVVAVGTGLVTSDLDDLVAAVRRHGCVSALTGTGVSMASTANVAEWLLWALHIVTDSYDRPGGMWFNPGYLMQLDERSLATSDGRPGRGPTSRPELPRRFGEWPCAALISEIEAGTVRTLFVVGGNPATAFPDASRTRAALASLDTLAVIDILPTETTALATHVLPAVGQLERADVPWLLDGYQLAVATQFTPAIVQPVEDRWPMWKMFAGIGERLGLDALGGRLGADTATDELLIRALAASSRGGADAVLAARHGTIHSGAVFGWVRDILPAGRWQLAPRPLIDQLAAIDPPAPARFTLIAHRQLRTMNSQLRNLADVAIHVSPDVAERLGGDGTEVEVRSAHGAVRGSIRGDERVPPGAVALPHGWAAPNVSGLTSADADIDPLTGMVTQSAVPVEIAALAQ
ncbi:MAG: putative dehydrogenase [Ilumatobacteraceae bacterium]|nr:putative dehydrogenase [Ilumatobacteraceae bacterium]